MCLCKKEVSVAEVEEARDVHLTRIPGAGCFQCLAAPVRVPEAALDKFPVLLGFLRISKGNNQREKYARVTQRTCDGNK